MLKLFGLIQSRSNRSHWALEELEVPYEFYQLDFRKGDQRSDFYLNLNPSGKVPTLQDGELVLTESGAICNYLGDKFPEKKLIPKAGTPQRGIYDQWMFFIQTELEQPLWTKGKHTFALPKEKRVEAVFETTRWEFKGAVKLMSQGLGEKAFILGDQITMIDIVLAQTLRWALGFKYDVDYQNLIDFLERMENRPSFKRMLSSEKRSIPT